jgi:hypothetical protein
MNDNAQDLSRTGYRRWLSWIVAILVPVMLILTAVRLLITPGAGHVDPHCRAPAYNPSLCPTGIPDSKFPT